MTIPKKYQIFRDKVILIHKDADRLRPHLESWDKLNEMFLLCVFNEPDLRRMVVIELMGERRWTILDRLLSRLSKMERRALSERVKSLCKK